MSEEALKPVHVVVVDMNVTASAPAGSCVLAQLPELWREARVTVLSAICDVQAPGLRWIKVPIPKTPLVLRYLAFQFGARWAGWRLRGESIDLVQCTQGQWIGADIVYAHFCHRAYLLGPWRQAKVGGLRRFARWLVHAMNARWEAQAVARARYVVAPSRGLAREIAEHYPGSAAKLRVLANPVDLPRFARPADFDRDAWRARLGLGDSQIGLAFMALGDFERKGLGLLIDALARLDVSTRAVLKLVVVGGQPSEIESFALNARNAGVEVSLHFAGLQGDVRPYLWACDVFVLPSAYEIFSLALLQAAAAGLPVMVSQGLYGAEEFVIDAHNGWVAERSVEGLEKALHRIASDRGLLEARAAAAVASVQRYSAEEFRAGWRAVYREALAPTRKLMPGHSGADVLGGGA